MSQKYAFLLFSDSVTYLIISYNTIKKNCFGKAMPWDKKKKGRTE